MSGTHGIEVISGSACVLKIYGKINYLEVPLMHDDYEYESEYKSKFRVTFIYNKDTGNLEWNDSWGD